MSTDELQAYAFELTDDIARALWKEITLPVTLFEDVHARAGHVKEEWVPPFVIARMIREARARSKAGLPLLKLARFGDAPTAKGSLRHDGNVIAVTGVEADYDGEEISFETACGVMRRAGVASILYTTPSHSEDKPRWRVLCPFTIDGTMTTGLPPAERREMMGRLARLFSPAGVMFSPESWALSQAYYYGGIVNGADHAPQVELIEGITIDQCPDLDDLPPPTPPKATRAEQHHNTDKSRSAAAFRIGAKARRDGATFEQMREAIRADPSTADWYREKGERNDARELRRIWDRAAAAAEPDHDDDVAEEIARLARLPLLKYEQQRQAAAKLMGVRASVLDLLVKAERGDAEAAIDTRGQGKPLDLQPPEPWPETVDGNDLLIELEDYFRRHLVLPEHGAKLLALWSVHTHCFILWRYTPRLHVTAATRNSGKSRVLAMVRMVAAKPLRCENITAAAVFRTIEAVHPTLLIDEADQFLAEIPDLVSILNGGHERGAQTIRAVTIGDTFEPRTFDTFAPVGFAGIGRLPGTLDSRCIKLQMQRARRGETPPDIEDVTETQGDRLARQIARWVADHLPELEAARPDMAGLINRLRNNWQPLFAIADVIGGDWPDLARKAASALDVTDDDADSLGEQLLGDIRAIFDDDFAQAVATGRDQNLMHWLTSDAIVQRLVALEGRPWAELGRERKPITKNRLARLLRPFKVYPGLVGPERVSGYLLTAFGEVFERHLSTRTGGIP